MDRLFCFIGGPSGPWVVDRQSPVIGDPLPVVTRLDVLNVAQASPEQSAGSAWVLRGSRSNERYVTRAEHDQLAAVQAPMGRPEASLAALIPIRKSDAWWALSQDERREIFEERSHHVAGTMKYLPAIARRLHHSRDLGGEPFDFLTWFDFAPEHASAFEDLVAQLRATEEWRYVVREVDLRLRRG